jgi:trehalose 6-phosphate phosphatase
VALDPGDPLAALRRQPATAGVFTDFDGTLAPIVRDPAAAKPVRGVPELLDGLAQRYGVVAVVSGRPVAFLAALLPASVLLSGLYGLEVQRYGERRVDSGAERWRAVIASAVIRCQAEAPASVVVEAKGLSLTLHYRSDPGLASRVEALAREIAEASGLVARAARMSVELQPPVAADKGKVVRSLAGHLRSVCYLGDDVGDVTAFSALDDLAALGVHAVRVAVRSDESPATLLRAADVIVDSPAGAVALLRTLLQPGSTARVQVKDP